MAENKKKILVVEDDMAMREILANKLSKFYTVLEAEEGKKAMDIWIKEKPDLVLLDLMIPEMDGFEVLEAMREHADREVAQAKVIVLSALWSKDQTEKAKKFAVEEYMVKTFQTTEDILEKVNKILK
jgi:two-component system response regulator VicR